MVIVKGRGREYRKGRRVNNETDDVEIIIQDKIDNCKGVTQFVN